MATTIDRPPSTPAPAGTGETSTQTPARFRHPAAGAPAPRQPERGGAVREGHRARGRHPRRRRAAGRPHRQAHRPVAQGQVPRRRAQRPRQGLVGRLQPADHRRALREAAAAVHRPHERARGLRPGRLRGRRSEVSPLPARLHRDRLGEHLLRQPVHPPRPVRPQAASSPTSRSSTRPPSGPTPSATASAARRSSWSTCRARRS